MEDQPQYERIGAEKSNIFSDSAYGARSVAVKADLHIGYTTVWSHADLLH